MADKRAGTSAERMVEWTAKDWPNTTDKKVRGLILGVVSLAK
jgi:hypothetical protein